MNEEQCGNCGYFDGMICRKKDIEVDSDEIIENCTDFEPSIYYR